MVPDKLALGSVVGEDDGGLIFREEVSQCVAGADGGYVDRAVGLDLFEGGVTTTAFDEPVNQELVDRRLRNSGDVPFRVVSCGLHLADCILDLVGLRVAAHPAFNPRDDVLVRPVAFDERVDGTVHPRVATSTGLWTLRYPVF